MVSLNKITTQGKALYLAYDQGLEHGPSDFDDKSLDPGYILKIGVEGGFNGIIFQKGIAEKYYGGAKWAGNIDNRLPLIVKLNGKTNLLKGDPYSHLLCTVDEAISLGAKAVGYTVYVGSEYEDEMMHEFSIVVREAHENNLPVIGWMYPRGKSIEGKELALTEYAARLGLELGADIVKIQYPGDLGILQRAVRVAGKTKVVVSGGSKENEQDFLDLARTVIKSGAMGMAVGRNIWQHKNPLELTKKLKEIIFEEKNLTNSS